MKQEIRVIQDLIENSDYTVSFTGAGISTSSGLPDFRGPNGFSNKTSRERRKPWYQYSPNEGHYALNRMIKYGWINKVISQNVDGLHLKSGIPRDFLIELHGNSSLMQCSYCDNQYHVDTIGWTRKYGRGRIDEEISPDQPVCLSCGGRLLSTVVDFGDKLDPDLLQQCRTESIRADLFIVMGSSLSVSPAAGFPKIAKKHGSALVIINQGDTKLDDLADLKIDQNLAEFLPQLAEYLEQKI